MQPAGVLGGSGPKRQRSPNQSVDGNGTERDSRVGLMFVGFVFFFLLEQIKVCISSWVKTCIGLGEGMSMQSRKLLSAVSSTNRRCVSKLCLMLFHS